jgi:hypothetical protein
MRARPSTAETLDRHVEDRFEIGGAAIYDLGVRGIERGPLARRQRPAFEIG